MLRYDLQVLRFRQYDCWFLAVFVTCEVWRMQSTNPVAIILHLVQISLLPCLQDWKWWSEVGRKVCRHTLCLVLGVPKTFRACTHLWTNLENAHSGKYLSAVHKSLNEFKIMRAAFLFGYCMFSHRHTYELMKALCKLDKVGVGFCLNIKVIFVAQNLKILVSSFHLWKAGVYMSSLFVRVGCQLIA